MCSTTAELVFAIKNAIIERDRSSYRRLHELALEALARGAVKADVK